MDDTTRFKIREAPESLRWWQMRAWHDDGHELICGSIGMGKSYWVLEKILRSFERGCPCTYIDPKGDTYRSLLALFMTNGRGRGCYQRYRERILFLNPVSPSGYILGFNALAPLGDIVHAQADQAALVANALTSHIRKLSGYDLGEAMRMQNIMAAGIATLAAGEGYSLAELPLLFVQTYHRQAGKRVVDPLNPFFQSLLSGVSHLGTKSFWVDQWSTWTHEAQRRGSSLLKDVSFSTSSTRDCSTPSAPPNTPA